MALPFPKEQFLVGVIAEAMNYNDKKILDILGNFDFTSRFNGKLVILMFCRFENSLAKISAYVLIQSYGDVQIS